MYVTSEYTSAERRITPSWSIAQLKTKMEPITGIPPSSQRITLKTLTNETIPLEAADEETTYLQSYPLAPYAEFQVRLHHTDFPHIYTESQCSLCSRSPICDLPRRGPTSMPLAWRST